MTSTEIAQIVTGIATLIVAVVLLFQLRKQNQQLDIQHTDTVGNVINQLNTRIENLDKLKDINKIFSGKVIQSYEMTSYNLD